MAVAVLVKELLLLKLLVLILFMVAVVEVVVKMVLVQPQLTLADILNTGVVVAVVRLTL
jgi:hypothetical protein